MGGGGELTCIGRNALCASLFPSVVSAKYTLHLIRKRVFVLSASFALLAFICLSDFWHSAT